MTNYPVRRQGQQSNRTNPSMRRMNNTNSSRSASNANADPLNRMISGFRQNPIDAIGKAIQIIKLLG